MPVLRSALLAVGLLHVPCGALFITRSVGSRRAHNESSALGLAAGDSDSTGLVSPRSPVLLHFMFLCIDHFPLPSIWAEFFRAAQPDAYMLWAHCVNQSLCERDPGISLVRARLVPTVYSQRGLDLMTPFVHMLRTAMLSTSHLPEAGVMEKFMVLSDSTLPVKPFPIIFGELASTRQSYYCFNNKQQWSKGSVDGVPMALPKHQQWVTLNRSEAALLVSDWRPVVAYQGWDVPLRGGRWAGQNRTVPRSTFKGGSWYTGTDEEATYAFTHGPLELRWKRAGAHWKHDGTHWKRDWARWMRDGALMGKLFMQRRCTTYVGFPDDIGVYDDYSLLQNGPDPAKQMTYPITLQLYRDPGNKLLVAEGAWHPFTIERLSVQSMLSLRGSDFLFARKFLANADLPNFTGIVLAA